jgi:hypothetical protein
LKKGRFGRQMPAGTAFIVFQEMRLELIAHGNLQFRFNTLKICMQEYYIP